MNSPITDLVIRIKNGYMAEKKSISAIYSKTNLRILEILKNEKYIESFELIDEDKKQHFTIELYYENDQPAVVDVRIISTPGRQIYTKTEAIPRVRGGLGIGILSTSKGIHLAKRAPQESRECDTCNRRAVCKS
jgi:small subunit ribosomal protein S8